MGRREMDMETPVQNAGVDGGEKREEEVNGTGLGEMNGAGRGGRRRDGATEEMGAERHKRGALTHLEGLPLTVSEGLRIGVPLSPGRGAHPTQECPRPFPWVGAALTTGWGCGAAGASHGISQAGAGVVT